MSLDAYILAGGQARRFGGRNKSMLVVDGLPLLARQIAMLRARRHRVAIVGGTRERHGAFGAPVLPDICAGRGALGGLYTALAHARTDRVLVLACDMPFVTGGFVEYLARTGRTDATVPRDARGLQPLCAVYARRAARTIRQAIDEDVRELRVAVGRLRLHLVEGRALSAFDLHGRLLHNINTPDDYERAIAPPG
jgi:molybdopterin-guanine dinucleotide biosynthesis protein A